MKTLDPYHKLYKRRDKLYWLLLVVISLFFIYESLSYKGLVSSTNIRVSTFLMKVGEALLVGGGIGLGVNMVSEKMRHEKEARERIHQNKKELLENLQTVQNNVQLARVLIRSHKSTDTYGEQLRSAILPSIVTLLEIRRSATNCSLHPLDDDLVPNFRVSIHFMIAYLSVLVEEFETHYTRFSNLQEYQEALETRIRDLFIELSEEELQSIISKKDTQFFLDRIQIVFERSNKPGLRNEVWKEIENLTYIKDFLNINMLNFRSKFNPSMYNDCFLKHYEHCRKILRHDIINIKLVKDPIFKKYLAILNNNDKKRLHSQTIDHKDRLTRIIMEKELGYSFQIMPSN